MIGFISLEIMSVVTVETSNELMAKTNPAEVRYMSAQDNQDLRTRLMALGEKP